MICFKKLFLLYLVFILGSVFSYSAVPVIKDTSNVNIRTSKSKIVAFQKDRDFDYDNVIEESSGLIDRIKEWLIRLFFKLFSNEGAFPYIRYAIFIAIVMLVLFNITKASLTSLFFSSKSINKIKTGILKEDIDHINFEEQIQNAVVSENYRLAIRYYYLKVLKLLSDKNLILWKIDKTNLDYSVELKSTPYGLDFKSITEMFEFAWYGNFPVSKSAFVNVKDKINYLEEKFKLNSNYEGTK
jgi:hypothetical protein